MAVKDPTNIIASPATIWYAPVGEALPNASSIAAGAAWGGNWKELGYTLEPVAIKVDTSTFELMVQQLLVPVRRLRTQTAIVLSTKLAEFTGDNLKLVTDGTLTVQTPTASLVGMDTVTVDASKTDMSLYAFGIEGVRVHSTNARLPVRLFVPRASLALKGDIAFANNAGVGLAVEITALADVSASTVLTIHNVTAPKS
jgi:hypothetical protein